MKFLVLVSICLTFLMVNIDLTIANLALPDIAHDFDVKLISVKWVLTAYLISSGAFMTLGGRLGDVVGLKKMYIIGLIIFSVFSFICGIAPNNTILILRRFFQGIGMALGFPLGFAIIANTYEGSQKAMAIAILNGVAGVTLAIGPTLGGIILHFLTWRWFFLLNVPIGVLATILGIFLIKSVPGKTDESVDKWGATTIILGLVVLLFGLNEVGRWKMGWLPWLIFAIGIAILCCYRLVEKRQKQPLIDPEVLHSPTMWKIFFVQSINQYIFFSVLITLSLYYQNILGYTSLHAGLILGVLTISFAIFCPIVGSLLKHIPSKVFVIIGTVFLALSALLFRIKVSDPTLFNLFLPLVVLGMGVACVQSTNMVIAMSSFSVEKSGIISSVIFSVCTLGGSIGTTVTSLNIAKMSTRWLTQGLQSMGQSVSKAKMLILEKAAEGSAKVSKLPYPSNIKLLVKESFFKAYDLVLWVFFILAVAAFIVSFFYKKEEKKPAS